MEIKNKSKCKSQRHVHEFLSSTMLEAPPGRQDLLHNHRFAGVSGPAIPGPRGHVHEIETRTDFFLNHYHFIKTLSGPPIPIYDKDNNEIGHVHGFSGTTTFQFMHDHEFKGVTLIEDPSSSEAL